MIWLPYPTRTGEKGKGMDYIYSLVKLFGERYIFCDDEQAALDLDNREELASAFAAILNFIRITVDGEDSADERH